MISPELCPMCGGEVFPQQVEYILRGGSHTASVQVISQVCLYCGNRLFTQDTRKIFARIKQKLEQDDTTDFQAIGISFSVNLNDSLNT
jgi:YgiT-type zinc finger domain-containing protein